MLGYLIAACIIYPGGDRVMEDRTFVLWRGQQRVNFNEDDLTADRISAVFRVRSSVIWHLKWK